MVSRCDCYRRTLNFFTQRYKLDIKGKSDARLANKWVVLFSICISLTAQIREII